MRPTAYPTLINVAETISPIELSMAPELSTLAALDATLLASTTLLEFNFPHLFGPSERKPILPQGTEEHLVDSICVLAKVLRGNLAAYYAAIHDRSGIPDAHEEFEF